MERTAVIIEIKDGIIKNANYGVIECAKRGETELYAFIINEYTTKFNPNNINQDSIKRELSRHGIDYLIEISTNCDDHENQKNGNTLFNPIEWSELVAQAVIHYNILAIFALSTHIGKEILPRVAAQLDAPLVMECLDVKRGNINNELDHNSYTLDDAKDYNYHLVKTSLYSGKTAANIKVTGDIRVFGIRPNVILPSYKIDDASTDKSLKIEKFTAKLNPNNSIKLIETKTEDSKGNDLLSADVIISGGRAMKNSENFKLLYDFADTLNNLGAATAVGASRVAVDLGWAPYSMQVGQTGEKVSPKVYIACGISGSIQHFAGMKSSELIIAINENRNAAIMSNCDYFVEADLFKIVPELIKELRK